jgi:O-antigen/teichoic acid export membrane protein
MTLLLARLARFPWRRISGFFLLQLISAVIPLVVLPFVVRMIGPAGWAGLSLGYSIGAAAAVLINFGWIVVGPGMVSGVSTARARFVYAEGLWSRLLLSLPFGALAFAGAVVLVPGSHSFLAGAMAVSLAATGLSPTWFYIGRGVPGRVALYDTIPRILGSVASIPLLALTGEPLMYPAALLVFGLIGVAVSATRELRMVGGESPTFHDIAQRIRIQLPLAISGVIMVGYTSLAVAFVSIGSRSVSVIADYAAGARLRSAAQAGISAFTSGLQGWASERSDGVMNPRKLRAALAMNSVIGLLAGAAFAVLAPWATSWLFGPEIALSQVAALWFGVSCFFYAVGASLSYHILGSLGAVKIISTSTIIASLIGIPLLIWLSAVAGTDGAAFATSVAEFTVVAIQLPIALRRLGLLTRAESPSTTLESNGAEDVHS